MEEIIMNDNTIIIISVLALVGLIIISISIFKILKSRINQKMKILEMQQNHESNMKDKEFAQKMEWEKYVREQLENKKYNDLKKEKEDLEDKVNKLQEEHNQSRIDETRRIILMNLILSGNKECISNEDLKKSIENIKQSYESIKQYIEN